jgi:hypothetical protein
MNAAVRTMRLSELRSRHPDDPPDSLERRLAGMLLELEQVYGPQELA